MRVPPRRHDANPERLQALSRVNTMAPVQAIWAQDNRGALIRVMGEAGDTSTHLENRSGEPLANPYLYMASQIYAGLDGIAAKRDPGPRPDATLQIDRRSAAGEPRTKRLRRYERMLCFRAGFGDGFVNYYAHLKHAEIARYRKETANEPEPGEVTAWEHREYFDSL